MRPSRRTGRGREAHREVREGSRDLSRRLEEVERTTRRNVRGWEDLAEVRKAHPEVQEGSISLSVGPKGPPRGPPGSGTPTQRSGRD